MTKHGQIRIQVPLPFPSISIAIAVAALHRIVVMTGTTPVRLDCAQVALKVPQDRREHLRSHFF